MDPIDPNNAFGFGILAFFLLAVITFFFISYKFMLGSGETPKKGEKLIMWGALVGVIFVVIYAVMAFVFKIIL